MRAKTMCMLLALGLLLLPAADAGPVEDAWEDLQQPMHCPPLLNEDYTLHEDCICPLDPDPLDLCANDP